MAYEFAIQGGGDDFKYNGLVIGDDDFNTNCLMMTSKIEAPKDSNSDKKPTASWWPPSDHWKIQRCISQGGGDNFKYNILMIGGDQRGDYFKTNGLVMTSKIEPPS